MTQYSGVFTLQQQGQALTSGQWATDPYYKNTTLLLHADNVSNGAQNNTFVDSSTNAFAITRNGNTTQGSFTPYGPTWSNYFVSGYPYLSFPTNAGYNFGTGDFTVEFWFYATSIADYTRFISNQVYSSAGIDIFWYSTGIGWTISGTEYKTSSAVTLGAWHHIAFSRSGTTLRVFVDGTLSNTFTGISANITSSNALVVGGYYNGTATFDGGYMSNVRLVKGTALYTSSFTPSTAPLTAVTNTTLLTCQSNRFIDNSSTAATATVNGVVSVQRFSPFAPQYQYTPAVIGGSGYFDGTGDYLLTPATGQFAPAGDFTIGVWVYPTAFNSYNVPIANFTTNASTDWEIEIPSNGSIAIYTNGSTARISAASGTVKLNQWQYIAIARSGSTITAYYNGASFGTYSQSGTFGSATKAIAIGAQPAAGGSPFVGYISDVLLIDGSAVTSVPSTPSTAISGTSLLLNFTNAGIYDNAMMNNLETVGNAQVSTSVVKYGSGSLAFDGSGDYCVFPASINPLYKFGTGDFTIEFWAWKSANGANNYDGVFGADTNGNATAGFAVELSSSRGFVFYNDSAVRVSSNFNPNDSTWHHYAVVRASGTMALYKDGVQLTTASYTGDLGCTPTVRMGIIGTVNYFNGYIDDLRITKGVARYTGNFIPPKVAFANQ